MGQGTRAATAEQRFREAMAEQRIREAMAGPPPRPCPQPPPLWLEPYYQPPKKFLGESRGSIRQSHCRNGHWRALWRRGLLGALWRHGLGWGVSGSSSGWWYVIPSRTSVIRTSLSRALSRALARASGMNALMKVSGSARSSIYNGPVFCHKLSRKQQVSGLTG